MDSKEIIVVPETHWDREWYLPFQEFRARLVIMLDKLLDILETDLDYENFTFDGQTIPIEDYLEVRPHKEEKIKHFVENGRLSIGPMYILPDEFLISGESLIRNLIIGHEYARRFGRVMKAGYIPDPFGHIAQLPQILNGCNIPSVIFWRGFGNEFEENNLNIEFKWNAPGNAASVLAIHLISSYGSLADIKTKKRKGIYKSALRRIRQVVSNLEKHTASPFVLLNNGSDHLEAQPEIPEIIKQWNEQNPEKIILQRDFEYYINKVLDYNPDLKSFIGELRGGKYAHLLSGVLSARMWIKQKNSSIETLYEKYVESISSFTYLLDKNDVFEYPRDYILTGYKWLIKNHPHDSICGCSIDQVHEEMKTRFDWAEQIGLEIIKNALITLSQSIKFTLNGDNYIPLIIINPLPWERTDIIQFTAIAPGKGSDKFPVDFKLLDADEREIEYQGYKIKEEPRYHQENDISKHFTFLAELPACGYKTYYLKTDERAKEINLNNDDKIISRIIENDFYQLEIGRKGKINVLDKENSQIYDNICSFEDVGDWGDEYDFSGPKENQIDLEFTNEDLNILEISPVVNGPTEQIFRIDINLKLPVSLTEERYRRENVLVDNPMRIFITLHKKIKRIDFKIELMNNSKDHRLRVLFPTNIKSEKVFADGHFYVIPRDVQIPSGDDWVQPPQPTNHQKKFVSVNDGSSCFSVYNKGLPEYEAIQNEDETITLALTLLRCVGWLSRDDFITRGAHAGPELETPGAQCLGSHIFEFSVSIDNNKKDWRQAKIHKRAMDYNHPPLVVFPKMIKTPMRFLDKIILNPSGMFSYYLDQANDSYERYLPDKLSLLHIDNDNILLSIIKKAERDNDLIIRIYNISNETQESNLKLDDSLPIKKANVVNLLEESPKNKINSEIKYIKDNTIHFSIGSHVISTIKIKIK